MLFNTDEICRKYGVNIQPVSGAATGGLSCQSLGMKSMVGNQQHRHSTFRIGTPDEEK